MKSNLAIVLLFCAVSYAINVPFTNCGEESDRLKIKQCDASVWPPQRGKKLDLTVDAELMGDDLKGGSYEIVVKFDNIPLITKTGDLKELGLVSFPIKAGPLNFKRSEDGTITPHVSGSKPTCRVQFVVPEMLPAGHYDIQLVLKDDGGARLMCSTLSGEVQEK